ncbi:MAG: hypothetical protein NTV29_02840 [Planctomycetota bacterium]|nr:hypothetical protein [Planctomycetota bacterium]
MRLVLGVDEAGYGPNLGPLVVAVSAWAIAPRVDVLDVLDVLDGLEPFAPEFQAASWTPKSDFVPFGDSKKIYQSGKGIRGLRFAMRFFDSIFEGKSTDKRPWFDLDHLAQEDIDRVESQHWYGRKYRSCAFGGVPQAIRDAAPETEDHLDDLSVSSCRRAREKLVKLGIQLIGFRLRVLDEAYFNACVNRLGNKSDVLGQLSLQLAWQVLAQCIDFSSWEGIEIYCDRQGGRKKYAGLLSTTYGLSHPDLQVPFCSVDSESQKVSVYSMRHAGFPMSIRFQVQGDSLFPPAAASMVAKWARESLMERYNRYWREIVGPALKPTAGYAVDAARFARDIEPWISKLGIEKNQWWRQR